MMLPFPHFMDAAMMYEQGVSSSSFPVCIPSTSVGMVSSETQDPDRAELM